MPRERTRTANQPSFNQQVNLAFLTKAHHVKKYDIATATEPYSISVIVPVYNSEAILPLLITRLEPVLESISHQYEVLLVNDGSKDGSWNIIQQLSTRYPWVRGINLMRNYGQHNALLCGLRAARHDLLITMDDDLQNPPEEIPKLLAKFCEGYDVVYGTAPSGRQGLWRQIASRITRFVLRRAMQVQAADQVSAFRMIRARICKAFSSYQSPFVSIDVLLSWGSSRFGSVPVAQGTRHSGVSNYTFCKLVTHAVTMVTGFSTWPLRVASLVGFGFTVLGLLALFFVITRYLLDGGSVPGFPFLASAIAIFSGAQLFALGIIGEYLARMHHRMMERPVYVEAESVGAQTTPALYAEHRL
jgi:undecaprenyl-phosphate 4-deoxy-4-formamido-L-arabinose transferase